jgi:hypothetical protein
MVAEDQLVAEVLEFYLRSADEASFNGFGASSGLRLFSGEASYRVALEELVTEDRLECVFERRDVNPHIKRLPILPKEMQIQWLATEPLSSFCLYPTPKLLADAVSPTECIDRPFTRALLLGDAQLAYATFELGVLARYRNDPRFVVRFYDYMGEIYLGDEFYRSADFPERDKIFVKTFGLAIDNESVPHIVVFYRYLADLTPEHQQYWNSYQSKHVPMCEQYFMSSVVGEWWKNRSIRHAIQEEMRLINEMAAAAFKKRLFRLDLTDDLPFDLSAFLVPSSDSFANFVHSWDKLLSENIDKSFFKGKISLSSEEQHSDGRTSVRNKGTIQLLREWLTLKITGPDRAEIVATIVEPLQEIRRLRQSPAHTFKPNEFSRDFFAKRRELLTKILDAMGMLRIMFAKLPSARGVEVPEWLNSTEIHVF